MTKSESTLPVRLLFEMLRSSEDGSLTWLERPASHFASGEKRSKEHAAANWNSRYAGTPALNCVTPFGHKTGRINYRMFYAHRVVWAMQAGAWPTYEIDHIDGDAGNNRFSNLRDVPHVLNLRNQARRSTNTTGFTGVSPFRRDGTWSASITVDGKSIHLGYFATPQEASAARVAAEAKHSFHTNHGRKAA